MREIDDRYPEFAAPYEPVKGGRHHKGLYLSIPETKRRRPLLLAFAVAGILLIMGSILYSRRTVLPEPGPEEPELPILIAQEPEPEPEPETEPGQPEEPPEQEPVAVLPEQPLPEEETEAVTEEVTEPPTTRTTLSPATTRTTEPPEETTRKTTKKTTTTRKTTTKTTRTTTTKESTTTTTTEPDEDLTDLEIQIVQVRYWGEFNSEYGLRHLQVEYSITANDADEGSITSSGSVTMVNGTPGSVSWDGKAGSGTIKADMNCDGTGVYSNSVAEWLTEVTVTYTLGGVEKTQKVSRQERTLPDSVHMEAEMVSCDIGTDYVTSAEYRVYFRFSADDIHDYTFDFTKAEIVWYENSWEDVGTKTLWNGGGTSPFGNRTTGSSGDGKYVRYTFRAEDFSVSPPSENAHYFRLIFSAKASGNDAYDSAVQLQTWDSDLIELP